MLFSFPWWSYVICFVVAHILGMLWYSRPVFGSKWMEVVGGKNMDQMSAEEKACVGKSMYLAFSVNAITTAVTILGIGYFANVFPFFPYITSIILCVVFVFTTVAGQIVWGPQRSFRLMAAHFFISGGFSFLMFLVTGLILQFSR